MQRYISHSAAESEKVAELIAQQLTGGMLVAYTGTMGAGKTTLTSGIVRALGGGNVVSSPTFALVNEYHTEKLTLYHFDMYRITDIDNLYSTGFFDYLDDPEAILFIEWSENIDSVLPEDAVRIDMAYGEEENERIITVEW